MPRGRSQRFARVRATTTPSQGLPRPNRSTSSSYKPTPENAAADDWTRKLVFGPATEAPDVPDNTLYDGQVADRAVASIKQLAQNRQQPFFLAVGFIKPHSPYIAPQKYWELYDPDEISIADAADFPDGAPKVAWHRSGELRRYTDQPKSGAIDTARQRRVKHAYYACISYIDAQLGRVLETLDEQGLSDDTIVVLWSDHGYHLGEQNLWGKTTNFELDTRVPLIVRVPQRAGNGQSSAALVELVDLFPTLVDLCHLPAPSQLEGNSFKPLLDDPHATWKSAAYSQFTRGKVRGYSVRTPTHRYTEWRNLETHEITDRELYDYGDTHPVERVNLAAVNPQMVTALASKLAAGHGWKVTRQEIPRTAPSKLTLAKVFADQMVLPRDRPVPVWGTAAASTPISVTIADQKHQTTADQYGRWRVELKPLHASTTPRELVVNDQTIRDVLVGDVWFCSGQSNMRWMLKQSKDAQPEIAAAGDQPTLRLLDMTGRIYPNGRAYDRDLLRNTTAENYYDTEGLAPRVCGIGGKFFGGCVVLWAAFDRA